MLMGDHLPTDEALVDLVRRHERAQRMNTLQELVASGHVRLTTDGAPNNMIVRVGDEKFTEACTGFPSIGLMARVQIAVQLGGQSCRVDEPYRPQVRGIDYDRAWLNEGFFLDDAEPDYLAGPTRVGITAPVTKQPGVWARAKSLLKGIRP